MSKPIDAVVYNDGSVVITLRDVFLTYSVTDLTEVIGLYMEEVAELKSKLADYENHLDELEQERGAE